MKPLPCALIAAAVIATAGPAAAQSIQELVGRYPMTVTAKSGDDCGGDDDDIRFVIHKIAGSRLTFGFEGEEREIADWDAATNSFRFEQAVADDSSGNQSGVLEGRFTRQPDAVRLDLKIETKSCTGTMVGLRPAPPIAETAAPTVTPPAGPATAASEDPAAAQPAAGAPAGGMSATQMAMLGGGGLALLAAGVALGWFLNRRRAAAPETKPAEPAAAPPPSDETDA